MRAATLTIAAVVALVVISALLLDEGEVVTLTTNGPSGAERETQLWIVANGDALYLRASSDGSEWLARVEAAPEVTLDRGEEKRRFRATPERRAEVRERVNRAMAEKYGFADRLVGLVADAEQSVPVRLEPLGPAPEAPSTARAH